MVVKVQTATLQTTLIISKSGLVPSVFLSRRSINTFTVSSGLTSYSNITEISAAPYEDQGEAARLLHVTTWLPVLDYFDPLCTSRLNLLA
ncbi:hypothetical protein VTJ04DRAFT_6977 [Mycothermus thermophilus]|uniref:uncharacterized protein n=1 Tax=Humicola insolens TaxID=85995 RepID=UPI00374456D8